MAEDMKIDIIKTETIKPSSPTPPHLKTFKLCLLDQLQPAIYGPVVYFYPKNDVTSEQRLKQLKKSLSEALTLFYQIAGRINDNITIECNDEGVQFVEAKFHGILSNFLDQPADPKGLKRFLPIGFNSQKAGTWPLLLVQATFFDCGGLAIGVCLSHKCADATTMGIVMKTWAATSKGSAQIVAPVLNAASYFPPSDLPFQGPGAELKKVECVTKRFVFDKEKIVALKAKTACDSVEQPTRVEVVTALIWKCVMSASRSSSGFVKKFVLSQSINIRRRADPSLPDNLVGNLIGNFLAETNEVEPEMQALVAELRQGIRNHRENKAKRLRGDGASEMILKDLKEVGDLIRRDDVALLIFTSLCNFQLYEEVDFGWGKPIWVTIPASGHNNVVVLMDTRWGGVEAWVSLSNEDMAFFESDIELLDFAYPSEENSVL